VSQGRRFVVLVAALALVAVVPPVVAAGRLTALAPTVRPIGTIHGVAYSPVPSDYAPCPSCPYYDTDFANADFPMLWGSATGARADLRTLGRSVHADLVHLYDWNPSRDHLPFLNEAQAQGVRVAVPISNYFASDPDGRRQLIEQIVRQVYVDGGGASSKVPHPAAAMWLIANEYDISNISAAQVTRVAEIIAATEASIGATTVLPVSSPVSFGVFGDPQGRPAIAKITELVKALQASTSLPADFLTTRFLAATNPQNRGTFIATWLPQYASAWGWLGFTPPLWFAELGTGVLLSCSGYPAPCTPSEAQQAVFNAEQWKNAIPGVPGAFFRGSAQFEWIDEPWKGSAATTNDATFGVQKYASPPSYQTYQTTGGTYRVDALVRKPSWASLIAAFSPLPGIPPPPVGCGPYPKIGCGPPPPVRL